MEKKQVSFGIYANQSDKRWNTFIEEINTLKERFKLDGLAPFFYGIDIEGRTCCGKSETFQTIITLDDYFAEGSVYRCVSKPTFKRGDRILVWNSNETNKEERIGITYIEGSKYPVAVVTKSHEFRFLTEINHVFDTSFFQYWQPLPIPNERQKLQQEIEQLEKELNVKREKLKEV